MFRIPYVLGLLSGFNFLSWTDYRNSVNPRKEWDKVTRFKVEVNIVTFRFLSMIATE